MYLQKPLAQPAMDTQTLAPPLTLSTIRNPANKPLRPPTRLLAAPSASLKTIDYQQRTRTPTDTASHADLTIMPVFVVSAEALNTDSSKGRATQPEPKLDILLPGEPVALDIEFQEYFIAGGAKWAHRIGRAAVVNTKGETILDVYAAYPANEDIKKKMPPEVTEHTPVEDAKATMALYLRKCPFDCEKAMAEYRASLPPPAETMVQRGKKWFPTAAAYAPLNLGRGYDYGDTQGTRGGKSEYGGKKGGVGNDGLGK